MTVRILQGDCREVLKTLPADSVHCCVTSPPYWSLRDYGCEGQIGLESTFTEFISEMVKVFREVRRVLRPDGTLWLNLGDSYATGGGRSIGRNDSGKEIQGRAVSTKTGGATGRATAAGLKDKDLCGIPWRVALALQEDGWWLRSEIIWSKPNPMPESVTDRPTKAHEQLFLFAKSPRYYYDAEAIKEASEYPDDNRKARARPDDYTDRSVNDRIAAINPKNATNYPTRNKRSVWEIATSPFPEAHFATFPPDLVMPCIKAGTSEKGCCSKCGAPWVRETTVERHAPAAPSGSREIERWSGGESNLGGRTTRKDLGWSPTCTCQAPVVPCTVLDCFGGAGTTGLVADRLQRNGILIELNPQYAEMAERRIFGDAPLFAAQ